MYSTTHIRTANLTWLCCVGRCIGGCAGGCVGGCVGRCVASGCVGGVLVRGSAFIVK